MIQLTNKENPSVKQASQNENLTVKKQQEEATEVKKSANEGLNALNADVEQTETKKETKEGTWAIKNELESQKYEQFPLKTYNEVVKGTELEQRMLKVMSHPDFENYPEMKGKSPEQRAEYLFRKINVSLCRFYARKLNIQTIDPVPEYLHKVIVPATEWFLMDILRGGQENNVQFLGELGKMNFESFSAIFDGVRNFSQKFSDVYAQAKKLIMISDFLSLPVQRGALQKLKNPYDFYQKVMKNPIWEQENLDLKTVKMNMFSLEDLKDDANANSEAQLQQGLEVVRASIGSIQMVDSNPDTVKKLLSVVGMSDSFFQKTEVVSDRLLDWMDKFGGIDKTLQSFWLDLFESLKSSKLVKGVLDFVLGLLWFSGGLDGLQRGWRRREIERNLNPEKKNFISEVMKTYTEKREKSDFSQQIIDQYNVKIKDEEKQKLNIDQNALKTTMLEKLTSVQQINPAVLNTMPSKALFVETVKNSEWKDELRVKSDFFSSEVLKQKCLDEYFQVVLPKLVKNEDFVKKLTSAEDLAFAITAGMGIQVDTVVLWMKAEALLPSEFFEEKNSLDENKQNTSEQKDNAAWVVEYKELKGYDGNLMRLTDVKGLSASELPSFQKKVEAISTNLWINPNWLMAVMYKESWLNAQEWKNRSGAAGLIQFMPKTLQSMNITREEILAMSPIKQLDYVEKFYEKNKGYDSLKDLYLEAFFPAARKHINNPDYVFESPKEWLSAETIARQNPIGPNKGATQLTMKDFDYYIQNIVQKVVPEEFQSQFA